MSNPSKAGAEMTENLVNGPTPRQNSVLAPIEKLCEDEGCNHAGIPHVCNPPPTLAAGGEVGDAVAWRTRLPDEEDEDGHPVMGGWYYSETPLQTSEPLITLASHQSALAQSAAEIERLRRELKIVAGQLRYATKSNAKNWDDLKVAEARAEAAADIARHYGSECNMLQNDNVDREDNIIRRDAAYTIEERIRTYLPAATTT